MEKKKDDHIKSSDFNFKHSRADVVLKTILRQIRKSLMELLTRLGAFKDWRLKNKEPYLLMPDLVALADKILLE